ncbi:MAG: hypothetical protein IT235_08990, partial [Bacteroidia bacterium]|nr:hypothetical protein [Bacteroidia bacterium]
HGAAITFIVWGALHGLVYVIEMMVKKKIKFPNKFTFLGWVYVILFHTLSLIAFRTNSISDLKIVYKKIFSFTYSSYPLGELTSINSYFPLALTGLLIVVLFIKELMEEFGVVSKSGFATRFVRPIFYLIVFVLIFVFGKFNSDQFIYTNF